LEGLEGVGGSRRPEEALEERHGDVCEERERERERVKSYNLQVISRFVPGVGAVLVGTCLHAKYLGQKTGAPNGVVVHSNRSSAGTVFWLEI
jgi:hypothetical protein